MHKRNSYNRKLIREGKLPENMKVNSDTGALSLLIDPDMIYLYKSHNNKDRSWEMRIVIDGKEVHREFTGKIQVTYAYRLAEKKYEEERAKYNNGRRI
jgi:hypothetical protein